MPEEQQAEAAPAEEGQEPGADRRRGEIKHGDRGAGGRDEVGGAATLISTVLVGVGSVYATTQSAWVTAMATVTAAVVVGIYLVRRPGRRW